MPVLLVETSALLRGSMDESLEGGRDRVWAEERGYVETTRRHWGNKKEVKLHSHTTIYTGISCSTEPCSVAHSLHKNMPAQSSPHPSLSPSSSPASADGLGLLDPAAVLPSTHGPPRDALPRCSPSSAPAPPRAIHPLTCVLSVASRPPRSPLLSPPRNCTVGPRVALLSGVSLLCHLHPPMSVATTNPFALLDGPSLSPLPPPFFLTPPTDNPSPPSSPPPSVPQPPVLSSNKPKPARSGNYYPRGGVRSAPKVPQQPHQDDPAPDSQRKCKSLSPSLSLPSLVTSRQPSQIPSCSSWFSPSRWPPSL